jgi:hypothetical protein
VLLRRDGDTASQVPVIDYEGLGCRVLAAGTASAVPVSNVHCRLRISLSLFWPVDIDELPPVETEGDSLTYDSLPHGQEEMTLKRS